MFFLFTIIVTKIGALSASGPQCKGAILKAFVSFAYLLNIL